MKTGSNRPARRFIAVITSKTAARWSLATGPERECDAAFIQLVGQEGVTGAYVTEIPPGKTLPSFRVAVDEVVYVLQGRGLASIWAGDRAKKIFEWQSHACFSFPETTIAS